MTCLLLHYRIQQQSGILARCILFCFVAFRRIYMYACFFLLFATTSLVNKDLYISTTPRGVMNSRLPYGTERPGDRRAMISPMLQLSSRFRHCTDARLNGYTGGTLSRR